MLETEICLETQPNDSVICTKPGLRTGLYFLLLLLCLKIQQLFHSFQEVRVRFAGFGAEEDEWVNVRKCVRQRSLPCESSECVAVLPGDLILCFQVLF
jgi:hypothetical protein